MKGYKAFHKGWTCRNFQYEIGKTYELPEWEELEICRCGFHFCANPIDVFAYYDSSDDTRIAEIEALGNIQQEGIKYCTDKIKIIREFTKEQLQELISDKNHNTGIGNSGSYNSGNFNSADFSSGNHNSGVYNSGNYNSGRYNEGNHNSGDSNEGNSNSGSLNSGNYNSGNCNSGDNNSGCYNSGDHNSGHFNSGDNNGGDRNCGHYNSGCCNSGCYNSGNFNGGIFNTNEPKMRAFNKIADLTFTEFLDSINYSFSDLCDRISNKEFYPEDYARIKALPNFDAEIFREITGIDIE